MYELGIVLNKKQLVIKFAAMTVRSISYSIIIMVSFNGLIIASAIK